MYVCPVCVKEFNARKTGALGAGNARWTYVLTASKRIF